MRHLSYTPVPKAVPGRTRWESILQLVEDLNEALANVAILESTRQKILFGGEPEHGAAYRSLIKHGVCFWPYPTSDDLAFAPSRLLSAFSSCWRRIVLTRARSRFVLFIELVSCRRFVKFLNRFVNVFVNQEDIRFLQNLDTPVKEGDEVSIVAAIAGG